MSRQDPITVVPSAARTVTGTGSGFSVPKGSENSDTTQLAFCVDITAASGTPTMTVSIEWSFDGTVWATADPADSFTANVTVSKKVKAFAKKAPFARLAWAIGGATPSVTFSVSAYGV